MVVPFLRVLFCKAQGSYYRIKTAFKPLSFFYTLLSYWTVHTLLKIRLCDRGLDFMEFPIFAIGPQAIQNAVDNITSNLLYKAHIFNSQGTICNWCTAIVQTSMAPYSVMPANSPLLECRPCWQTPSPWSVTPQERCRYWATAVRACPGPCQHSCTGMHGCGCPPFPAWRTHCRAASHDMMKWSNNARSSFTL